VGLVASPASAASVPGRRPSAAIGADRSGCRARTLRPGSPATAGRRAYSAWPLTEDASAVGINTGRERKIEAVGATPAGRGR
jgi:hypothetical protein